MSAIALVGGWFMAFIGLATASVYRHRAIRSSALAQQASMARDQAATLAAMCILNPPMSEGLAEGLLDAAAPRVGDCDDATLMDWMERVARDELLLAALRGCVVETAELVALDEAETWIRTGLMRAMQDRIYPVSKMATRPSARLVFWSDRGCFGQRRTETTPADLFACARMTSAPSVG